MIETFTALAEPNRLRIVELLRAGPQAVGDISEHLQLRLPVAQVGAESQIHPCLQIHALRS